jgi:hypothetical protein
MKKSILSGIVLFTILVSCKKLDNDIFFKIGKNLEYRFSDIELYDTSTNIIYFRNEHDEFKKIEKESFEFLDNGDLIYSGSFWPGYSSSGPTGPFIWSPPSMFGNYALKIDNWHPDKPDLRKDPRIIALLIQNNLLHSGLTVSSSSIEINGLQLTFKFTVTNHDLSDVMIIDINKTGPNLFHYFTNGLYIRDLSHNEVFTSNIQHQVPEPWNSFETDWLSQLKSGDFKQFSINYTLNNSLRPGEYYATFIFPGLAYQVTKDQLYYESSRIWLGDIQFTKKIFIDSIK